MVANSYPWSASRNSERKGKAVDTSSLRAALAPPTHLLEEDVRSLPIVKYHGNRLRNALEGGGLIGSFLYKSLGYVSMMPVLMSGGGMSTPDYYVRYNDSARTQELIDKGYRLLLTPKLVKDLNSFMRAPKRKMSASALSLLVSKFDEAFSPRGDLENWMSFLVCHEFLSRSKIRENKQYDPSSGATHQNGGMRGGFNNAYWGIAQFSIATYNWVAGFGREQGLALPMRREDMNFEQQLVVAYVYGVLNQSIIRPWVRGELQAADLYLAHNQGAGSFKTKKISATRFYAQSESVQDLLRKRGFAIV